MQRDRSTARSRRLPSVRTTPWRESTWKITCRGKCCKTSRLTERATGRKESNDGSGGRGNLPEVPEGFRRQPAHARIGHEISLPVLRHVFRRKGESKDKEVILSNDSIGTY